MTDEEYIKLTRGRLQRATTLHADNRTAQNKLTAEARALADGQDAIWATILGYQSLLRALGHEED